MRHRLVESIDAATIARIDDLTHRAPNAHFTQHPVWAGVPAEDRAGRWMWLVGDEAGQVRVSALVRLRRAALGGPVLADVFRGPMAETPELLLEAVRALEGHLTPLKPLGVRLDAFWSAGGTDALREGLDRLGYTPMNEPPWSGRTLEVAIDREPERILESFRKETRYDVRRALKLRLDVREDLDDAGLAEFEGLYRNMIETKGANRRPDGFFRAIRDGFRAWPSRGFFLASWMGAELLGAIAIYTLGRRAIYAYGASSRSQPGVPKTHLLQYEAMMRARARGCTVYDMGGFGAGVGEDGARTPAQRVNYFKSGFGGTPVDFVPACEKILRPLPYRIVRSVRRLLP